MQIGTIRTSFPGARERTRHDVLACLSIDAAAFKSLLLGAGCHGRANHQTGSRPAPALFARGNLMGRTLALRGRTVVSETSRFGRGCVRVAGESHTTRCAARESICYAWRSRVPRVIALKAASAAAVGRRENGSVSPDWQHSRSDHDTLGCGACPDVTPRVCLRLDAFEAADTNCVTSFASGPVTFALAAALAGPAATCSLALALIGSPLFGLSLGRFRRTFGSTA